MCFEQGEKSVVLGGYGGYARNMKIYGEVDALDNFGALVREGAGAKNILKKFPSGTHGTQADARVFGGDDGGSA